MYGGEPNGKDASLLGTREMKAVIDTLKKQCDIVVLDTAPSELLADAPLLARYVDAALYVVRYDYTKMRQILEGVQALSMSGIHVLGYVFNNDASSKGRGYGYGYGGYNGRYGGYSGRYGAYSRYGSYSRYGTYARGTSEEKGSTDRYGRVIKE